MSRTTEIADDWAERWREFHRPLVLGDRLTVRPPWEPPGDDRARRRDRPRPGVRHRRPRHHPAVPGADARRPERGGVVRRPRLRLGRAGDRRRQARLGAGARARLRPGGGRRDRARTPCATASSSRCGASTCAPSRCPRATWWRPTFSPARCSHGPRPSAGCRRRLILSGLLADEADRVAAAFANRGLLEREPARPRRVGGAGLRRALVRARAAPRWTTAAAPNLGHAADAGPAPR